jgi:hypothetical protein
LPEAPGIWSIGNDTNTQQSITRLQKSRGPIVELPLGLLLGLLSGLEAASYVSPSAPGKALQRSRRNALVSGLSVVLLFGLVFFGLTFMVFGTTAFGLIEGEVLGLILALFGA